MYNNPVEIIETNNWQEECNKVQKTLGIHSPLVITSNGNLKRNNLASIFNLESIFSNIAPDPTLESCQHAIDFINTSKFDGVIAIGGGSVMDTAKTVMASIGTGLDNLTELLKVTNPFDNKIPSIFLPTTHGTGSEVTMWGTIWNIEEKRKYSISHPDLYPNVAILDGNLTLSLPLDISIISTLDALSHSFEAIWNKYANPTSTSYAIEAILLIIANIDCFKKEPNNLDIRNRLMIASNKAGLAFSNTKTAAAHSISYPLTLRYGMPHGIASSISLIPLLIINRNLIQDSIDKICIKSNLTFESLVTVIKSIPTDILSFTLDAWGVKEGQLEELSLESFANDRINNNIVELKHEQILRVLKSIW